MNSPKPTDSEQLDANLRRIIGIARYSEKGGIAEDTAVNEIKHLIAQRDQQRLSAVLAEMPKKYEAPGLHRSELGDREYTKQVYYNLGVVHCQQALTAALGPDNSSVEEE